MIDIQRYLLLGAIALLSFMLLTEYVNFNKDFEDRVVASETTPQTSANNQLPLTVSNGEDDIPVVVSEVAAPELVNKLSNEHLITVSTDVLSVKIDPKGGDIVYAGLVEHLADIEKTDPFVILENTEARTYIAQSGLVGPQGTDKPGIRPLFKSAASHYQLKEGQDQLNVDLVLQQDNGAVITKRISFQRGEYLVDVNYLINNRSNQTWQAGLFAQLKRDNTADPSQSDNAMGMAPFLGVAYYDNEKPFNKIKLDDLAEEPLELRQKGGWIGIIQHYFLSAWVPDSNSNNSYAALVSKVSGQNFARVTTPVKSVAAGEQGEIKAQLYVGPKDQYRLQEISSGLELSVDYGILWWIAQPLFFMLTKFFALSGNWGVSIILVTLLVKILFFPLNNTAFKSMANMRRMQPKLVELRERHGDDRQKQSQAMMELYKKEKINPLGGCLPMLVQMPVFISLYWVLLESVELRHAPFFGYITDLSAMDPYFILPLVMGASMFIQQKLNPPPPDPMQAKVMQWMPVIFTFFFLFFPSGLVLYWVVNNILSITQQYVITKRIEAADAK